MWLPPDCLGQLEDALASDSSIGVVGPLLLSRSEPEQVLSLGISFSERSGRMREDLADELAHQQQETDLQRHDVIE